MGPESLSYLRSPKKEKLAEEIPEMILAERKQLCDT